MKPNQKKEVETRETSKEAQSNSETDQEKPKNAFTRFFSKMGYSIWIAVMVVGGIIAFLISLLVL
ncbi:hypothetical protein [Salegentibacter mishustinae]|jgi:uncharacterized membrane protein|uniref:hypothetical protein n=1 Tax=Salegentibacter mishustinae TaxID=270918 RepID=UPI00248FFD2B|nr:hypothetical protein [Salegentibacter mishustinae]